VADLKTRNPRRASAPQGPDLSSKLALEGISSPPSDPLEKKSHGGVGPVPFGRSDLTSSENAWLALQEERMKECCAYVGEFERYSVGAAGIRQHRMFLALPCGARICPRCSEVHRSQKQKRVTGIWGTFITLTYSHNDISCADAWRSVHKWINRFTRALRKDYPKESGWKLEYAWVLEPHKDWYPHVHMVTNVPKHDIPRIVELWRNSCRLYVGWVTIKFVTEQNGVCRYLAKYLKKAFIHPLILAILGKRRLFASTTPVEEEESDGWRKKSTMTADECDRWLKEAGPRYIQYGWTMERDVAGVLLEYSRPDVRIVTSGVEMTPGEEKWMKCLLRNWK